MKAGCGEGRKKTLLLVDDESALRSLMREELAEDGYVVIPVGTGTEALHVLERGTPALDLVVTDARHPEPDGLELVRIVKSRWPKVPVILNTAYDAYKWDDYTAAPDAYVVKTADLAELKSQVRRLLEA